MKALGDFQELYTRDKENPLKDCYHCFVQFLSRCPHLLFFGPFSKNYEFDRHVCGFYVRVQAKFFESIFVVNGSRFEATSLLKLGTISREFQALSTS